PAARSRQSTACRRDRSGSCAESPWSRRAPQSPPAYAFDSRRSYPSLETLERRPEAFAHVLMALPDLGNERGARRMLAQHGADLVKIDFAFANLQAFAIETLGVAEMQMSRVRTELRQTLGEVEAEMIGGKLGVGDVDAH